MTESLFTPLDERTYQPTALTRGPWSPEAQHGAPPSALLARSIERIPGDADEPMQVARLTVELLRPVPLTPLRVETAVERHGRKVQLVGAALYAGEVEVARARALRIRTGEYADMGGHVPPDESVAPVPSEPGPELERMRATWDGFHNTAMDLRFVDGAFTSLGPATAWFRLVVPVVPDEEPTPLCRVVVAADFGNGISRVFLSEEHTFINPDLTIHLARLPRGEWVAMRSATCTGPGGVGLAESAVFDEDGRIGRSVQSLLLDRR